MAIFTENNISRLYFWIPLTIIFFLMGSVSTFMVLQVREEVRAEIDLIKGDHNKAALLSLTNQTRAIMDYISTRREMSISTLRDSIRKRTRESCLVAEHIYKQGQSFDSPEELAMHLKHYWNSIHWNGGRGYFFVLDLEGRVLVHGGIPKMEGTQILDLSDSKGNKFVRSFLELILSPAGEGFHEYDFPNPTEPNNPPQHKVSFVKYFAPCKWIVGCGDYLDDYEREVKEGVKERLRELIYPENERTLILSLSGQIEFNPTNPSLEGKFVQELLDRPQKKFLNWILDNSPKDLNVYYGSPDYTADPLLRFPQFVCAKLVPGWNWILARVHTENDLDEVIASRRKHLEEQARYKLIYNGFIFLVFSLIAVLISLVSSRKLRAIFRKYDKTVSARTEELTRSQKEAERANQAKSLFLANMSHEIRTPLNSMLGFAELLDNDEVKGELRNYAQSCVASGRHLRELIDDLLDISKIEAGRMQIENIPFEPSKLLVETLHLLEASAVQKSLRFYHELTPDVPPILLGDPKRIQQILFNFICNAIKFTSKGEVTCRVQCLHSKDQKATIEFTVRDTGIGIEENVLPDIWSPFVQGDLTSTKRFGGAGLGLYICSQLANLMGGEVRAESTPGEGSTFSFTCTFAVPPEDLPQKENKRSTPVCEQVRPMDILLVEDCIDNQLLIQAYLSKSPHLLDLAENGQEAVEKATARDYDLIFMDLQMPVMDGSEATRQIRDWEQKEGRQPVPIVILSAYSQTEIIQQKLSASGADYLMKPVTRESVLKCLAKHGKI
ncbi:MAG: cache domain-containing protein [Planctomycetes bacterium]|nr:cache domain-containing protein [Planctomycetota bacterium]